MTNTNETSFSDIDFGKRARRYLGRTFAPLRGSGTDDGESQLRVIAAHAGVVAAPKAKPVLRAAETGITAKGKGSIAGPFLRRANRSRWVRGADGSYTVAS